MERDEKETRAVMSWIDTGKNQRTIAQDAVYKGVGLHTGNKCHLVFKPAPENAGVVFVRTDLPGAPVIPANYKGVSSVIRGTTISLPDNPEARVHTVEHVLSALYGLEIDNLIIEVNANEPPVADGSSRPFIEVLQKAGIVEQKAQRRSWRPEAFEYRSGETTYKVEPADGLFIETTIDFNHPLIQKQTRAFEVTTENYLAEVAAARTFCFDYEVEALKRQGLAKGGSLDNAVVVGMDKIHNKEKSLRWPDEFVRHKTLDLIGDLYLLGARLEARITASRVGHGYNVNVVKQIASAFDGSAAEPAAPNARAS
jgi:UDP-3-O-[3-hydroxymyristoyl] N-acetylglucosamine deacetylase/3-hydroxyacyl-[acyl-carrier-protein] dehydratase